MIDRNRILATEGYLDALDRRRGACAPGTPGAKPYEVRPLAGGMRIVAFITAGVNGHTADATAVRNLADMSEQCAEPLALYVGGALPLYSNGSRRIAQADGGLVQLADGVEL
jgi:hypothetical protein